MNFEKSVRKSVREKMSQKPPFPTTIDTETLIIACSFNTCTNPL